MKKKMMKKWKSLHVIWIIPFLNWAWEWKRFEAIRQKETKIEFILRVRADIWNDIQYSQQFKSFIYAAHWHSSSSSSSLLSSLSHSQLIHGVSQLEFLQLHSAEKKVDVDWFSSDVPILYFSGLNNNFVLLEIFFLNIVINNSN